MIHWLKNDYQVTVIGWNSIQLDGVKSISLFGEDRPDVEKITTGKYRGIKRYLHFLVYAYRLLTRRYEYIVWSRLGGARELQNDLALKGFDLIVSHDCTLLPLAFSVQGKHSKIVLDAREYYGREYEDRWQWRLLTKPVNRYLCDRYLHQCDKIFTVNDGLAEEYAKEYGVLPEVVMSLPHFADLEPRPVEDSKIKIIYHGFPSPSRGTETMIEMMDFIDQRFTLDMMLMVSHGKYWEKILSMAKARKNVNIIPPVPMHEIVPFTSQYDIGLYLCPPTSFNQKYTLPNKFFEFIQARLAVAIGPSIEMKKIVDKYECGVVSEDFSPRSLADELNRLTVDRLMFYKQQSHRAAHELCSDTSRKQVQAVFDKLLCNN
jgi:glycosyltransferase involved in cell wall biosynthesis